MFVYQKSSTELVVKPTKPESLTIQYPFTKPIRFCSAENSLFTCITGDQVAILDEKNTGWIYKKTDIAEPSAVASLMRNGSLFVAIANSQRPHNIEIIARHKNSADDLYYTCGNQPHAELSSTQLSFATPITTIVWARYGSYPIVCMSDDGSIHIISTSNIFNKTDQS